MTARSSPPAPARVPQRPQDRRTGILLALATAGISGVAVFVNASGVAAFGSPTVYTTAKNLVAAGVLAAVVALGGRTRTALTRPAGTRQWMGLGVIGLIGGSVPFVLFFEGLSRASSPQAAVIHKTLLVWVALLAAPLLGERLGRGHWLAVGLLVVGQLGLSGGLPSSVTGPGSMILAATLLWSVEVVVAKRLLRGLSSWTVGVARMGLGSVALLVWLAVRGQLGAITSMTGVQLGWSLATGVILAGYVGTWFAALARAQAVDVTAVLVLAVPVTAVLDRVMTGAALAPQGVWLSLVLTGGALAVALGWRGGVRQSHVGARA